jgi:hypothetical protein
MQANRTKVVVALAATAVLVGAVAGGRHLISGTQAPSATGAVAFHPPSAPSRSATAAGAPLRTPSPSATQKSLAPQDAGLSGNTSSTKASGQGAGSATGLAAVPVSAFAPQVVHTATMEMRVGKGKLNSSLHAVAILAGADGGYVDSSSLSGGTARRSPVSGSIVFRVLDSDFADAIARVAVLGTVDDQQIQGKDVTVQVAQNAASIAVLQDEVALLEKKLGQATDIGTFLQIESQLFPVEQQLQKLQSAQAVLENSAALATVTVSLSAPGAPVVTAPPVRPHADAATVAWHYLRHNTLAVLDGLAVAGGWALPAIIVFALVGMVALRIVRRRRHVVNPV